MGKKLKPVFRNRHRQLLLMVKDSWFKLSIATVCMLTMSASTAAMAYLIKPALDDVFIRKDTRMLKLIPVAVLAVYLVRCLGMFGQQYLMSYVGQDIIRQLRNRLYNRIQDLPLAFFQREQTGVLMSRITYDVNIVRNMVSNAVTGSLRDCFTIFGLVFVIFYQIWDLALFAFLVLPVAFYPIVVFGRRVRRFSTGCQEAMADMSAFLHETFAGNKIVKAFGMEAYEKGRFYQKTRRLFRVEMKEVKVKSLSSPVMEMLGGLGVAFVIFYGGANVISGRYSTGTFVSFLAAVVMLYDPIKKLSKLNNIMQRGLAATDRVFDIIETQSELQEADNPLTIRPGSHGVTFDDVSFKYDDTLVLENIRLSAGAGEVIALVGMSGGGKTTLVNLIPRFYDVSRGAVCIDGVDVRRVSVKSLREQIAVVTQEPILFNDSIRHNIAYGNPDASLAQIEAAAAAAYADEFVRRLPEGFDTPIGELGGRLSGGEKQRICIARALLKDAPILILDEATSALDTEAEALVQKALGNLMKGRTTFVIAHRLSTIAYADRIVVLKNGHIVESGQHRDLLAARGEYYKLHQMQFANGQGNAR